MNDPTPWSLDQDPPRDDVLARQLRAAGGTAPDHDVDWERLRATIMAAAGSAGTAGHHPPGEWWDVVVQWRRVAAAASVAAMLAAGALVWRSGWAGRGVRHRRGHGARIRRAGARGRGLSRRCRPGVFPGNRPQRRVYLVGRPMSEPRKSRLVAGVVIVLVFLAGTAVGFFLHHSMLPRRGFPGLAIGGSRRARRRR